MSMPWLYLLLSCLPQEPPDAVREYAEKLGSDRHEVRREAALKLKSMGKEALPLLRSLVRHADPEVRFWTQAILDTFTPDLELVRTFVSRGGFAFSPDGSLLAHPSDDGKLAVLSTEKWETRFAVTVEGPEKRCSPEFSPDGKTLFALVTPDEISAIPVEKGRVEARFPLKQVTGEIKNPIRIIVGDRGPLLVIAARGVLRWSDQGVFHRLVMADDIVVDPSGDRMIGFMSSRKKTAGGAGFITYDPRTLKALKSFPLERTADLVAAPAGLGRLYVGDKWGSRITIFSPDPFAEVTSRVVQPLNLTCLAASPDGAWILTGDSEGKVRILGGEDLSPLGILDVEPRPVGIRVSGARKFVGVELDDPHAGKHLRIYRNRILD